MRRPTQLRSMATVGSSVRKHLSYANVVATLALFIALGGSSYAAIKLPRDSVGPNQIRSKAVGSSEVRSSALRSRHLRSGSVTKSKLSDSAIAALRGREGPQGPAGPAGPSSLTFKTSIDPNGRRVRGDPAGSSTRGIGGREVEFGRSLRGCVATATLADVDAEASEPPPTGHITVSQEGDNVLVRTFNGNGEPTNIGFNLIVAC